MLHPVALAALTVLVLNDHVWKARYPGWVTGKLSDVAGLIVFPLVACALARVVVRARPERVLAAAIAATMLGFALVKLWPPATHACALAMGALQAPLSPSPVTIVRDPTDLLALPFALVAWWLPRSVADRAAMCVDARRDAGLQLAASRRHAWNRVAWSFHKGGSRRTRRTFHPTR
jgi:hypothetical protein